jgi:hypothetical protein
VQKLHMSQLSEQGQLPCRLLEESVETEEALLVAVQHLSGEEYMQVKQLRQIPRLCFSLHKKGHLEKLTSIHLHCDTLKYIMQHVIYYHPRLDIRAANLRCDKVA